MRFSLLLLQLVLQTQFASMQFSGSNLVIVNFWGSPETNASGSEESRGHNGILQEPNFLVWPGDKLTLTHSKNRGGTTGYTTISAASVITSILMVVC